MKNNIQILQSYSNTFRDLINDKNLRAKDTIKGALRLNKLNNVPDPREAFEKIKALKIREIRHKIASHPCDYINSEQNDKLESYVPVRLYLSGFNIGFVKGEKIEIET